MSVWILYPIQVDRKKGGPNTSSSGVSPALWEDSVSSFEHSGKYEYSIIWKKATFKHQFATYVSSY